VQRLYFGEFSAEIDDRGCHGLYRGREPIGLSDVPRKVLFLLLRHRPRPVPAKVILGELWHAGANPSNVAKQVRALRTALGDEATGRYMRTLGKEGYAFVMPVTEAPAGPDGSGAEARRLDEPRVEQPGAGDGAGLSKADWKLMRDKLLTDFRQSCLHDIELLDEAIEECGSRMQLIASHRHFSLANRLAEDGVQVPRRSTSGPWPTPSRPDEPDAVAASAAAALVAHAGRSPILVNVGSYAPACIAVLQSLRRRFGLDVRADFQDLTGRQQILRLHHDDEADFLLAPHAPFLLVGDYRALFYRWMTPVHGYEQALLQMPGTPRGGRTRLLVYRDGSPEEQVMAGAGIPASAAPELVSGLEKLLAAVAELDPGDLVIAWEPLASGLESRHGLTRVVQFKLWVSLYCHKRWQRGALRRLRDQFVRLFSSEWSYCLRHREWALECLAVELKALAFFTAGSGLGAPP
jgi:DNA-binding winged helix-turn-helix (wHTH) protein